MARVDSEVVRAAYIRGRAEEGLHLSERMVALAERFVDDFPDVGRAFADVADVISNRAGRQLEELRLELKKVSHDPVLAKSVADVLADQGLSYERR